MNDERPSSTAGVLPNALRDALGEVVAHERRKWRRAVETMEAEARAIVVELRNERDALLRQLEEAVSARFAKFPLAQEWRDAVHYEGEVVTFGGATYQAQRDTGREPTHDDWVCIVAGGRDGANGKSLTIRGTWNGAAAYQHLDIVVMNGASFAARKDNPGPCPGEGWQMIAAQGKRGPPGEPGRSVRGEQGPPGPPGPAAVALDVDADGVLRQTNADGSVLSADFYPLLSKLTH